VSTTEGRTGLSVVVTCGCGARTGTEITSEPCFDCGHCDREHTLHVRQKTQEDGLLGCLACGHLELYTRKKFPRAAGLAIVLAAAVLAPWTNYLSLVAAAALDFVLHRLTPDVVVCYVCGAEHHGFASKPRHPRYDREIAERLRYGQRAVMGKPMRPGGTADAPEPEH
jgi:hypothetical protein